METLSEEEKKAIIEYGIARGKVMLVSTVVTLISGCFFGIFMQSVIFMIIFCLLRRYAGGYHANSQTKCYIISFVTVIISFCIIKKIDCGMELGFGIHVICMLIIILLAPIENQNRKLDAHERIKHGSKTRIIAITLFVVSCFMYRINNSIFIKPTVIAYILVAVSLVTGYIKNINEKKKLLLYKRNVM